MRFYVASKTRHASLWRHFRDHHGVYISSSWIDEAGPGQTANMRELWDRIGNEISMCDRLILYFKEDDQPLKGAFVEVGMAIAMGKPVWIIPDGIDIIGPTAQPLGSWVNHRLVSVVFGTRQEQFDKAFKETV